MQSGSKILSRIGKSVKLLFLIGDSKSCQYPEEGSGGSRGHRPVADLALLGEVGGGVDRHLHPLDGEEGGEVGGVRGDHDEGEEPPEGGHSAGRDGPGKNNKLVWLPHVGTAQKAA